MRLTETPESEENRNKLRLGRNTQEAEEAPLLRV